MMITKKRRRRRRTAETRANIHSALTMSQALFQPLEMQRLPLDHPTLKEITFKVIDM